VALREKFGLRTVDLTQLIQEMKIRRPSDGFISRQERRIAEAVEQTIAKMFQVIQVDTGFIDFKVLFDINEETANSTCGPSKRAKPAVEREVFSDPSGYGLTAEEYYAINGGLAIGNIAVDSDDTRQSSSGGNESAGIPIHLEIGSGDGEWIAAQAAACTHTDNRTKSVSVSAYWIALELRHDRVYNTICQHLFNSPPSTHSRAVNDMDTSKGSYPHHHEKQSKSNKRKDHLLTVESVTQTNAANSHSHNLAILGGDAVCIINQRFASASVSAIFINHPQPPEKILETKANGRLSSQGKHLLTKEFFTSLHRILSLSTGRITIVTDSQQYAQLLAQILVDMAESTHRKSALEQGDGEAQVAVFVSAEMPSDSHSRRQLEQRFTLPTGGSNSNSNSNMRGNNNSNSSSSSIDIWRGEPGEVGGHVAQGASSYFDRMWLKGNKSKRWFLFLKPVHIGSS